MPTNRNRIMITESDELGKGLELASTFWPECADSKSELLRKVIHEGISALEEKAKDSQTKRIQALEKLIAASAGMWPEDWNEKRKAEWPD